MTLPGNRFAAQLLGVQMTDFIEVTRATVLVSGAVAAKPTTVSLSHIVQVSGGAFDTGLIILSNGTTFNTMESYPKLKTILGI